MNAQTDVPPQVWAEAVRDHQRCLAEWDARALEDPGAVFTFHAADTHLPREFLSSAHPTEETT